MKHFKLILNTKEQNLDLVRACSPFDVLPPCTPDLPGCTSDQPHCVTDYPTCLGTQGDVCTSGEQCEVGDEPAGCEPINDQCFSNDSSDCTTGTDNCDYQDSTGGCTVYDSCAADADECQDAMDVCYVDLC